MAGGRGFPSRFESKAFLAQCFFDLSVGGVLTQGIHGPDGGGDPANDRELQNQADNSSHGSADREEREPGEDKRNQESHQGSFHSSGVADGW